MIILGIDPGSATTGFGLIESQKNGFKLVDFGWIETNKDEIWGKRLSFIHRELGLIIKKYKPHIIAIENLFFATNAKTAMAVSEASGVIKLAAAHKKIPVVGYAPMQIKMAICGSGKADKEAMKKEVRKLLKFRSPNHKKTYFDDVCDALAVAICHVKRNL